MNPLAFQQLLMGDATPDPTVVSLLHMDSSFVDETGKVWSNVGSPTISNSVFKFGGGSGLFNATSLIQTTNSADFAFGLGDFTVECWAYATTMPTGLFFCPTGNWVSSTGGCFFLRPNGVMSWHTMSFSVASANGVIALNNWYHLAYSRNSTTGRLFVNGVQVATGSDSLNITSIQGWRVGNNSTGSDGWRGYVDEVRITKGVGRYTANFTPPSAAFPYP